MPKVKLTGATYSVELGGRLPEGAVLDVSEEHAQQWISKGIAEPAPDSAKTFREEQRAERKAAAEAEAKEPKEPNTSTITGRGKNPTA
jgi:hypothetical protein